MAVLIVVGIIVLIVIWAVSLYNGLVRLRNRRQNAFADIDVQLRQRHDLIPQLVETVKGYAAHEKDLLLKITGFDLARCPCCCEGMMIIVGDLPALSISPRVDSS